MANFALFIVLITTGSLVAAMPYSTTGRAEHKGEFSAAINNTSAAINNTGRAEHKGEFSAAINNTSAAINNTSAAINNTGRAERLDPVGKVLESIFMSDPVVWVAGHAWSGLTWVNSQASHVLGFLRSVFTLF